MPHADLVILGAGVAGCSLAWHLAQSGSMQITVLERNSAPGQGSTRYATGGFRAQHSTGINVQLSLLSRKKLLAFQDETGMDCEYQPCGYLMCARSEEQMNLLRRALAVQRSAGLEASREVTVDEMSRINPHLSTQDLIGGTFCPLDGFIRPLKILEGYRTAAERAGVRFLYNEGEVEVLGEGSGENCKVRGVKTKTGEMSTRCVVNATGAWAGTVQSPVSPLPVSPARRQVAITQPFTMLPADMPLTIDLENGFHLRMRDDRALLLWPEETTGAHPFDNTFDASWLPGLLQRAYHRIPCLRQADIALDECWCGLYEMTPDHHALLGAVPEMEGYFALCGNSGHGVMHSPAQGHLMAQLLTGEKPDIDISSLRVSRFAENQAIADLGIL